MRNLDILDAACSLLCETVGTSADYESRAPYVLGTFLRTCKQVDRDWRTAYGLDPAPTHQNYPSMDEEFPLVDELIPAATYYLAAMLVMDENSDLYEKLFDLFTDAVATVAASIPEPQPQPVAPIPPAILHPIKNVD